MQIITWILGAIAAYRLWENTTWLSVVAILLVLSYSVHRDEQQQQDVTGMFSTATATRLMLTFYAVIIIFLYSLFT